MQSQPPYNPNAYDPLQASAPIREPEEKEGKRLLLQNDDVESEMDDGEPCWRHIFTRFGMWAFLGAIYWLALTLWGWHFHYSSSDVALYYYTISSCAVALACIMAVFVGITRGIELGDERAVKWIVWYCMVSMVNIWVHTYCSRQENVYLPYSVAFIVCDFVSLFYISFTFYGFHKAANRAFRARNFVFEWFDLASQIAVAVIYSHYSKASVSRTDRYTDLFWVFILIQLFFWVLPIIFGAGNSKVSCLRQLFVLDVITDIPLLLINIISGAFLLQFWILIDLVFKILFMCRYFYVFLKYFKHSDLKEYPTHVFCFCPYFKCCEEYM